MKKILFLAAGLFASATMVAQSYEASLGLGALSSGSLKFEGMYHIDNNHSFNLELRTINSSIEDDSIVAFVASFGGIVLSPEYITYFNSSGDDNEGMYLGTYLRFKSMASDGYMETDGSALLVDADFSQLALGIGGNVGYHGAFDNGITVRVYAGLGYNFLNNISHTDGHESILSAVYAVPIHVRSGINLGYRF
ncbi:MAG TPA: hypothetical protein DCG83_04925 [Cryomorphaceae bacterium]|nr:hypothetical protein [Cryomorphaceae bacterium]